jgi:hypothetical protein
LAGQLLLLSAGLRGLVAELRDAALLENYKKLRAGMTRGEVELVLGRSPDGQRAMPLPFHSGPFLPGRGWPTATADEWVMPGATLRVYFSRDGILCGRQYGGGQTFAAWLCSFWPW